MNQIKIKTKQNKKVKQGGFSLLELMVALGISGILITANQTMFQQQNKSQKTISIKTEMQNLEFRIKSILRTQEGCMGTLNGNSVTTSTPVSSANDFGIAQNECMTNGLNLSNGFTKRSLKINLGNVSSGSSGAPVMVNQAKIIFLENLLSPSTPNVDAIICYQLSTQGIIEGSAYGSTDSNGQISRWFYEAVVVKNIYDPNPLNTDPTTSDPSIITTCNSDISSVTSANCTSLGGEFVEATNECSSLNVDVAKDESGNIINTSPMIAENSAITAQGNISSSGHGVICGSLHVGVDDSESKVPTSCGDNLAQDQAGNLYVGKSIQAKDEIMSDIGLFTSAIRVGLGGSGKAIIDSTLEVTESLTAIKGLVQTENLSVNGTADFNKSVGIKGDLKVDGASEFNNIGIKEDSISSPGGLNFYSGGSDHTFHSKVKAIGDDSQFDTGAPDYLATMTYVNRLMLSKMTDEDRQKLFNELIKSAEQTGVDKVAMYAVTEKLKLVSGLNQIPYGGSWMCQAGYSFKRLVKYCDASTCYIGADCQPIQQLSGTTSNCKWYRSTQSYERVPLGDGIDRQ